MNLLREFTFEDFRSSLAEEAKENLNLVERNLQQDTDTIKALMARTYPGFKPEDGRWIARRVFYLGLSLASDYWL